MRVSQPEENQMGQIERFQAYAAAFEEAFKNDDWSVVEPYFTEDAVYEIFGGEPFAGRHEGRDAILAYMKQSLDGFDRRFESRALDTLEGPSLKDGAVWMRWRVTYRVADAPPLVVEGEETATFEGDRIRRLEDQMPADASATQRFFEEHGDKLESAG
jgi:hypothetical protein